MLISLGVMFLGWWVRVSWLEVGLVGEVGGSWWRADSGGKVGEALADVNVRCVACERGVGFEDVSLIGCLMMALVVGMVANVQ